MTIATDLERLALLDGVVVGRQLEQTPGAERDEQRAKLAARACAQDRLARPRVLGLKQREWRTRGEDASAVVSFVWSILWR